MSLGGTLNVYGQSNINETVLAESFNELHRKDPVRVATQGNIADLSSPPSTIDGVSMVDGDRVLVHLQSDAKENGIYVYYSTGFVRSDDFDSTDNMVPSSHVHIHEGTVSADDSHILTNDTAVSPGVDSINWVKYHSAGQSSDIETLTNKTIDASSNSLSNISDAEIKAGANIDVAKLGTGVVDNTEFNLLNGRTTELVDTGSSQTLQNKTINTSNNTISVNSADVTYGTQVMINDSYATPGSGVTCVGSGAGSSSAGNFTVLIGNSAGNSGASANSVAVGYTAGAGGLGTSSIAIGYRACHPSSGHSNAIVLNATGSSLTTTANGQFIVAPIRDTAMVSTSKPLSYNTTTKEVTCHNDLNIPGNLIVGNDNTAGGVSINYVYVGSAVDADRGTWSCNMPKDAGLTPASYGTWDVLLAGVNNGGGGSQLYFHAKNDTGTRYYTINAGGSFWTAQHQCGNPGTLNATANVGLIVRANGTFNNEATKHVNDCHPDVILTNTNNDKAVFGVVTNYDQNENPASTTTYADHEARPFNFANDLPTSKIRVNSGGEGMLYVCDINGNLANGDYITSCTCPGYGMRQDDDILHSYTVGKITQDCDFSNPDRYIQADGTVLADEQAYNAYAGAKYKVCFVGCSYHMA